MAVSSAATATPASTMERPQARRPPATPMRYVAATASEPPTKAKMGSSVEESPAETMSMVAPRPAPAATPRR